MADAAASTTTAAAIFRTYTSPRSLPFHGPGREPAHHVALEYHREHYGWSYYNHGCGHYVTPAHLREARTRENMKLFQEKMKDTGRSMRFFMVSS
jgi:hypothetical protein